MTTLRAPIDPAAVVAGLEAPGRWQIRHTPSTGSTNADLVAEAAALPAGSVLITEEQLTGRGRLGRTWTAPAGSSLMMSVLLRPDPVPPAARGWIGAILGLAVVEAIGAVEAIGRVEAIGAGEAIGGGTGPRADLKWPNDVLIDGRKCAGILAELAGDALVVGVGINVTLTPDELPANPGATPPTSLQLAGAAAAGLDRAGLAAAVLNSFGPLLDRWYAAAGDADRSGLLADYRRRCSTVSARVAVQLPGGDRVDGTAIDVDPDGRLLVRDDADVLHRYTAADVQHLRPAHQRPPAPAPPTVIPTAGQHNRSAR